MISGAMFTVTIIPARHRRSVPDRTVIATAIGAVIRTTIVVAAGACAAGLFALGTACTAIPAAAAETACGYDAASRCLTVTTAAGRRFRYRFNPGGAVCGLHDLDLGPETNLVGDPFEGETTDRVIQWTYWNSRYRAAAHGSGDRDRRANVTMEGSFGGRQVCDVLETPPAGPACTLVFRSRITHWFYSELDRHGRPDFETTSRYRVLDDGSLRLDREVIRHPWRLRDVVERRWEDGGWRESPVADTLLVAEHARPGSIDSYFECWTPLRRSVLPAARHGRGTFDRDGYRFWSPADLGGYAVAHGDTLAVAVVFGTCAPAAGGTRPAFNRMDLPGHDLNVLQPAIEVTWPDDTVLAHSLVLVVGAPDDVSRRAAVLVPTLPCPTVRPR